MRRAFGVVSALAFLALLAACSNNGVRRQINPPGASIQQLAVQPDGTWQLTVRLQNFSNVSTTFASLTGKLLIASEDAGSFSAAPGIGIGPESADVVIANLSPALGAKLQVAAALATAQPVAYTLSGEVVTSEPKGRHDFTYTSTLTPAPGLRGVLR